MAAKTVKMCDLPKRIAADVFKNLNTEKVQIHEVHGVRGTFCIYTDVEPKDLIYPEGWYYAKGTFTNKHTSTTGIYHEVIMYKTSGESWETYARYCTLHD